MWISKKPSGISGGKWNWRNLQKIGGVLTQWLKRSDRARSFFKKWIWHPQALVILLGFFYWTYPNAPAVAGQWEYWLSKWELLTYLLAAALGFEVWKRSTFLAGIATSYFIFSGARTFAQKESFTKFMDITPLSQLIMDECSTNSTLYFILAVALMCLWDVEGLRKFRKWVGWFGLLDALYVIGQWFAGARGNDLAGGLYQCSMNALAVGLCLPFSLELVKKKRDKWIIWVPMIWFFLLVTISGQASVGPGVMVITAFCYLFHGAKRTKKVGIYAVCAVFGGIIGLLIAWKTFLPKLFNDSARIGLYKLMFIWWKLRGEIWLGYGMGSFIAIGREIQKANGYFASADSYGPNGFLWLHSSWGEILFNDGIIGLCLAGLVYAQALWKARHDRSIFSSLVGYGAGSVFQFPAQLAPTAIMAAWLLASALRPDPRFELDAFIKALPKKPLKNTGNI